MDNSKGMLEALAELYCTSNYTEDFETILEASEGVEKASIRLFELRPGFELMISSMEQRQNLIANVEEKGSQLTISFCLSGRMRASFRDQKDDFIVGHGQNILCFTPRSMCTAEYHSGQTYDYVNIRIEPRSMTPSMYMAVHQILDCPYHGHIKRIYLESKSMELIAHQLALLVSKEIGLKSSPALNSNDIEKIHYARDILVASAENPPSLLNLAKQAGLNDYKLKIGFRHVFGTTVFGYLQKHRMEQARMLLEEGKMNVTEVAYTVGYSSLSHFAKIFHQHFSTNPSSLLC
jgi:AraC-like DNA-binding protein